MCFNVLTMSALGATGVESLSTGEFYEELTRIDFSAEGPRIRTYSVDLDPAAFIGSLSVSNELVSVSSSDGAVSHVRENPVASAADNSASSRYFSPHSDGIYLPEVPGIVVLHCVDPGSSGIPTVFVDTKDIIGALADHERLEDAKDYEFIFRNKQGLDFARPLIEVSPTTGEPVMNSAIATPQCLLHPVAASGKTQEDADALSSLLEEIVTEEVPIESHTWQRDDAVVFDNVRLIHGRGLSEHKFLQTSDVQRHLHRIWLARKQA